MVSYTVESRRSSVDWGGAHASSIEALLQIVIKRLEQDGQPEALALAEQFADGLSKALCTIELDGARYTLIRHQSVEPTTSALSPRELAVARLIAQGLPNKCIADILEISQWTVATHLRRIFIKLGVNSRAAMVARLSADGLLAERALGRA